MPWNLTERLRRFARGEPGSRFQDRYRRAHEQKKRPLLHKVLFMGGGFVIVCVGMVLMPAPGPGMLIVALGAALMAQESLAMSKILDRLEVWGRELLKPVNARWQKMSGFARASVFAVLALGAAGFMYLSYTVIMR